MMRNRKAIFAITAAAILSVLPQSGLASKKKPQLPKIDPSTLVWPMPPDKPRVRFIESWENNLQIEPIRKRSWADKLAGVSEKNVIEDFGKPAGVALDSKGRIYIASVSRGLLYIIDKEHKQLARFNGDNGISF